ncbi:MAG: efflux RND transporter periplasmic adaptor subunit [Desulfobacteraceae bacterium]|nr:efflux RND transporter periplasmic adaptor subunit [Desulfobacteraceae bacterium]
MIKRMIIMLVCVGLLFGGIFGYKAFVGHMIAKAMSAQRMPSVTVSTTTAQEQTWQPRIEAVGTVRAMRGVDVTTEIAGLVRDITFQSGDDVREGQVLVQLNADADRALLHSLQAEAELARTTFARDQQQFNVKAVSKATLDAAQFDLKSKEAQVAQQAAIVEKKTIRAPFSGHIGITTVNPGQYLNPGDKIATLQAYDSVYVDFLVPQQDAAQVALEQTVAAATNTYPNRSFAGTITAINPAVDPQTRNLQVEATIPNPKHELLPGMFATVQVQAGQAQQFLTLPQTAVTYNPYGETVFVVEKKEAAQGPPELIAKQTFVTTGATRGDQVAITEGLKAGDTVVTSGQLKLKSGSPITVNNEIQPSDQAAPQPKDE